MCEIQLIASLLGVMFPSLPVWRVEDMENLFHCPSQKESCFISFMFDQPCDTKRQSAITGISPRWALAWALSWNDSFLATISYETKRKDWGFVRWRKVVRGAAVCALDGCPCVRKLSGMQACIHTPSVWINWLWMRRCKARSGRLQSGVPARDRPPRERVKTRCV